MGKAHSLKKQKKKNKKKGNLKVSGSCSFGKKKKRGLERKKMDYGLNLW